MDTLQFNFHGLPQKLLIAIKGLENNANQLVQVFNEFGLKGLSPDIFLNENMLRIGEKPYRLELLKTISGVDFEECYQERNLHMIDGLEVPVIDLENLKKNKLAAGRKKDEDDYEQLVKIEIESKKKKE